jgi:hypothetical protein
MTPPLEERREIARGLGLEKCGHCLALCPYCPRLLELRPDLYPVPLEPSRPGGKLCNHPEYRDLARRESMPPRTASCRHLGDPIGLRECGPCGGKTRVKVFVCRHPAHVETTIVECRTCPDYMPYPDSPG